MEKRELEIRAREAREVRERSWQELPLGPVPVFQRKCRRPNLWPPEEGDLVAPAYCPFYHLLLLMGLSPYGQGLIMKKQPGQLTSKLARVIKMDFCEDLRVLSFKTCNKIILTWPQPGLQKVQMNCIFTVVNITNLCQDWWCNPPEKLRLYSLFPSCVASKRKSQSGKTLWLVGSGSWCNH